VISNYCTRRLKDTICGELEEHPTAIGCEYVAERVCVCVRVKDTVRESKIVFVT